MFENLDQLQQFHWLRPVWLLGLPVAALLMLFLSRLQARGNSWQQLIDPELLPHLLQGRFSRPSRWPLVMLTLALWLASLSMAGPAWEKLPQPVHKTESALVILLDLSPSMLAQDIKPSRLVRARLKLIDLLKQRREGLSALVVYAGEAHIVTPLTDDNATIISLLPSLSPAIMPLGGSNTEMALDHASKLFKEAGIAEGDLLLVTDGVSSEAIRYYQRELPSGLRLSVLGVGSDEGAPIPVAQGGFIKDHSGSIVLAKLNSPSLANLAAEGGGRYRTLSADDSDISALVRNDPLLSEKTRQIEREFDAWLDRGAWLTLLLLPFAALAFRRGWFLSLLPLILLLPPETGYAFGWQDLWTTPDQRGQELLQKGQPKQAAEQFQRPDWRAAAQYQAGDFQQAAESYAQQDSASGHYNRGNSLARAGKLPEALKAYDAALEHQPQMEDALANRKLVEDLLRQQQEQEQQQNGDDSQQDQEPSESQNNDQQSQSGDQQNSDPSNNSPNSEQNSEESPERDSNESPERDSNESPERDSENSPQQDSEESPQQDSEESPQSDSQKNQQQGQSSEQQAQAKPSELSDEEQQAMEQWLRKIPDDPSGLMRKKFEHQYRQRRKQYQQGTWQPPENEANKRW